MKDCKKCGAAIETKARTCPVCGAGQRGARSHRICPDCGSSYSDAEAYCQTCGYRRGGTAATSRPAPYTKPYTPPRQTTQQPSTQVPPPPAGTWPTTQKADTWPNRPSAGQKTPQSNHKLSVVIALIITGVVLFGLIVPQIVYFLGVDTDNGDYYEDPYSDDYWNHGLDEEEWLAYARSEDELRLLQAYNHTELFAYLPDNWTQSLGVSNDGQSLLAMDTLRYTADMDTMDAGVLYANGVHYQTAVPTSYSAISPLRAKSSVQAEALAQLQAFYPDYRFDTGKVQAKEIALGTSGAEKRYLSSYLSLLHSLGLLDDGISESAITLMQLSGTYAANDTTYRFSAISGICFITSGGVTYWHTPFLQFAYAQGNQLEELLPQLQAALASCSEDTAWRAKSLQKACSLWESIRYSHWEWDSNTYDYDLFVDNYYGWEDTGVSPLPVAELVEALPKKDLYRFAEGFYLAAYDTAYVSQYGDLYYAPSENILLQLEAEVDSGTFSITQAQGTE